MNFRDKGERIAAEFLKRKGYQILAHNFKKRDFEIDLIARKKNLIVFVEVKRRISSDFMDPIKGIDRKKRINIIKGAKYFLLLNDLYNKTDVRFDAITISGYDEKIHHYEDAFRVADPLT
ncbi:MAG: YraN family protein [candidate division WOR-3 bacterium]|nr:YraN family protein [candidate division WOR-3 bacterium]